MSAQFEVAASLVGSIESTPSVFGVQGAVALYLINPSEFQQQTSLVLARDWVVGICSDYWSCGSYSINCGVRLPPSR